MSWNDDLAAWMGQTGRDSKALAALCGVHERTVNRWKEALSAPDKEARRRLEALGFRMPALPKHTAERASKRIEDKLEEILKRLKRIEKKLAHPLAPDKS